MHSAVRVAHTLEPGVEPGRIDDPVERSRLDRYLHSGTAVLFTTGKAPDVFAPELGAVVPMSLRSDGEWVWSDAHAYYMENYGLVTDEDLLAHIRAQSYVCRRIDGDEAERVLEAFYSATG